MDLPFWYFVAFGMFGALYFIKNDYFAIIALSCKFNKFNTEHIFDVYSRFEIMIYEKLLLIALVSAIKSTGLITAA